MIRSSVKMINKDHHMHAAAGVVQAVEQGTAEKPEVVSVLWDATGETTSEKVADLEVLGSN